MESQFEAVYGPSGDWAQFFRLDEAYQGTELVRDLRSERKYLTLDYWSSEQSYNEFRKQHQSEYGAIDQKCEAMIEAEREIGIYAPCGADTHVPDR